MPFNSVASAIVLASLAACGGGGSQTDPIAEAERQAVRLFNQTPVAVFGRVVADDGRPVNGVQLRVGDRQVLSGQDGRFRLDGLPRRNALLSVSGAGMRETVMPLYLHRPITVSEVDIDQVILAPADPATVRFLFAGDTSFGRRFLDVDGLTPRGIVPTDRSDALIQASNPLPGSRAGLAFVQPLFATADYRAVNLETPVTNSPTTPHEAKDFVFFTLPGSLPALTGIGVDYVSLGNNHVYDYLDSGLADTLRFVDSAGLARSGAGLQSASSFAPWRTSLGGSSYSLLSMSSIAGSEHAINYVATATKGGSADLRDDSAVQTAIGSERAAGRFPIAVLHTGQEYTEQPGAYALGRMQMAASSGASLVIAHHPHVAQGFSRHAGTLIAHSLGNFLFDQDRLETMLGLLAQVDMAGGTVRRAEAVPVYLEDYRPRLIAGPLADRLLRRIGQDSHNHGVTLMPINSRGVVLGENEAAVNEEREVVLQATIASTGYAVLDLREQLRPGESLASAVTATSGLQLIAGRDLLEHGDFEDQDIDDQTTEIARWDTGASSFACLQTPRSGAVALCSRRSSTDSQDAVVSFRNRVRVLGDATDEPNKFLTLYGWVRGNNAGPVSIVSRYYASEGNAVFGEQRPLTRSGGEYGWQPFAADLSMPAETSPATGITNARAVRLFLRHSPPAQGNGLASFDDLALINWEPKTAGPTLQLATPNIRDFIRVEGVPGNATVRVVLRRQRPAFNAP